MDDIIKRELNKFRSEIIKSLLQTHHLRDVRGRALLQVMIGVLAEFEEIIEQLENIKLEPLRRKLRNEYNVLSRGAKERSMPSTVSEYVAANLPNLIEAEIQKIFGPENRKTGERKKARTNNFQ